MSRHYNWKVYVNYGDGQDETAFGGAASLDAALSAAHAQVADDMRDTLVEAQHELRRVAATYNTPPSEPYRSVLEEAVETHEAPYSQHHAGIEYLRTEATGSDAESVVEEDVGAWCTAHKVRELASTDSASDTSAQQTVWLHDEWQYHIRVDVDA